MTGKRKYVDDDGYLRLAPGEYGKDNRGVWYARPPRLSMGCLDGHEVVEHPDGTITVSPSISIVGPSGRWHGYLEKGVWREC